MNRDVEVSGNIVDESSLPDERKGSLVDANLLEEMPDVPQGDAFGLRRDRIEDARITHIVWVFKLYTCLF